MSIKSKLVMVALMVALSGCSRQTAPFEAYPIPELFQRVDGVDSWGQFAPYWHWNMYLYREQYTRPSDGERTKKAPRPGKSGNKTKGKPSRP